MVSYDWNPGFRYGGITVPTTPDSGCNSGRYIHSERIKLARMKNGYSQESLASLLSVSRQSVSKWESGECYPEMETMLNLAGVLDVSLDWLWAEELFHSDLEMTSQNAEVPPNNSSHDFNNRIGEIDFPDIVDRIMRNNSSSDLVKTGIRSFDEYFGGLRRRNTYLLSAPVSMGKELFALTAACNMIFQNNQKVLFFALRTPLTTILRRILHIRTGVDPKWLSDDEDKKFITQEYNTLKTTSLIVNDTPGISLSDLYDACVAESNLDLIIIDRYQNLNNDSPGAVINVLQKICMKCDCPVLVLNKIEGDLREDENDKLEMYTEDGELDFITDIAICDFDNHYYLYRPYYYDTDREKNAYIFAAKDSAGLKGYCKMEYDAERQQLR